MAAKGRFNMLNKRARPHVRNDNLSGSQAIVGARVGPQRLRGFTVIELVAVMVIVGVLAAMGAQRFFARNAFESRGFYDQVISTLRYAQKTAIAQNRFVCVAFGASSITLTYDPIPYHVVTHSAAACPGINLADPTGKTPYILDAPSGVTLSNYSDFNFSAQGVPSTAPQNISVSGYTAAPIRVELETGYVH